MALARHVDPDTIISELSETPQARSTDRLLSESLLNNQLPYSTRYANKVDIIPRFRCPDNGSQPEHVYRLIHDELDLDGRPCLNLASFVETFMDDRGRMLVTENIEKNVADADEYPTLMALHTRCVSMLANLWHPSSNERAVGSATTGSSEAVMLGGLAMKKRWQDRMTKKYGEREMRLRRPNIIMGVNAQVALLKFARYWDVEARTIGVTRDSEWRLDEGQIKQNVDENTIGIFVILGSTYTGHYEPVETISNILDEVQAEHGWDIPIHVDGASGGFVAPFTYVGGGQKWDFELPRVKSINTSGHKYGLVYPGLGWIIWRDRSYLPSDLVFELSYLGSTEESFTLNFSRPGAQVIGQYYNFVRLGFRGYRAIMEACLSNARFLSRGIESTGWFECVSAIHRRKGIRFYDEDEERHAFETPKTHPGFSVDEKSDSFNPGLPCVAFRLKDQFHEQYPHVKQEDISTLLRAHQYTVPNYPLPATPGQLAAEERAHSEKGFDESAPKSEEYTPEILRIVVRESMSRDLLASLLQDLIWCVETLIERTADWDKTKEGPPAQPFKYRNRPSILSQPEKTGLEIRAKADVKKAMDQHPGLSTEPRRSQQGKIGHRSVC